jgi:hypothetical protein
MLLVKDTRQLVEVQANAVKMLGLCRGIRTIAEHREAIAQSGLFDAMHSHAIGMTLDWFVMVGLLRQATVYAADTGGIAARSKPITSIGIVTRDRPVMLQRCLAHILQQCRRYGHRPRIVVIDGSQDVSNLEANARAVRHVATTCEFDGLYIGPKEAAGLRVQLEAAGIDAHVAALVCTTGPAGANRNLLQLVTAGEHVLMIDDDVVFEARSCSHSDDGLAIAGDENIHDLLHYPTRADAISSTVGVDVDLLDRHEKLLGSSLAELLSRHPEARLDDACAHVIASLRDDIPYVVRGTMTGVVGDAGIHCPAGLWLGNAARPGGAVPGEAQYSLAMASREVVRVAARTTVAHGTWCMATCLAVINDGHLPPFLHRGRNEDGVFGALLGIGRPESMFGHLPFGVVHDSKRQPEYNRAKPLSTSETRLADLILALLPAPVRVPWVTRGPSALDRFARDLIHLGQLTLADFADACSNVVLQARLNVINAALASAGSARTPVYWREAVQRYAESLMASASDPRFFVPVECRDAPGETGFQQAQSHVRTFGELIASWPDIWRVAKDNNCKLWWQ